MWKTKLTAIDSKNGKWKLIFATAIIAFVFINVFEPYGLYGGSKQSDVVVFLEVCIAIFVAVLVLILSHFVLKRVGRISSFTYATIVILFFCEAFFCGGLWTLLSILSGDVTTSLIDVWLENVIEYIFLIGLPYFFALFYLNYKEKNKTVKSLLEVINEDKVNPESLVSFMEASGIEKVRIPLKNLLYLESSDNYVLVHHQSNQSIEKYMLRNTLKNLENNLRAYNLMRCHRSYIVNPLNVNSQTKTAKGLSLKLKSTAEIVIPVSKPYMSEFQKKFN